MPFGPYEDWDACIVDQTGKGHDKESAAKICGTIKAKTEKNMSTVEIFKDVWSTSYKNDLPDSAFLVVESGGHKDSEGKTIPRSLRHFPVRDANGKLDEAHLKDALSRIPQSKLGDNLKSQATAEAERLYSKFKKTKKANEEIEKSRLIMTPKLKGDLTSADLTAGGGIVNRGQGKLHPRKAGKLKEVRGMYKSDDSEDIKKFCAYCGTGLDCEEVIEKATLPIQLFKSDRAEEEQYVLGVVLEPEVEDSQGDIYSADEIRKSAYTFMENFGDMGLQHNGIVNDQIKILETYIAPTDFEIEGQTIQKGTWMLGARIVDESLWQDVKKGALTGWSIGGSAIRVPE